MKKIYSLLLIALMIMLVATGCVKDATVDPVDPVDDGPRVLRKTGSKLTTLNQHIYENTSESSVMGFIYGNLLEFVYDEETKQGKVIGNHAVDVPAKNDEGTVWTFKLRDGLQFSDGTKIDAYTYLDSYKLLLDPKLANYRANVFFDEVNVVNAEAYFSGDVADFSEVGIKALDASTLEITIAYPTPEIDFQLTFVGGGPTSPIHLELFESCYLDEEKTENNYGTSLETTPSSGPYKLVEWTRDQYRKYEKVDNTPMSADYVPTEIQERVVEDRSARMQLFENGETDYTSITGPDYDTYSEDPRLVFYESTTVWSMFINMTSEDKPFLTDVNFRQAMYYAMPREMITSSIYKTAAPAAYVVSTAKIADPKTGLRYRDSEAAKKVMPKNNGYDVEEAKKYMDKAFEKHGKIEVQLDYFESSDNMKRIAELLEQEYEKAFGTDKIDVVLQAVPWQTSYENMENGTYDMAFGGWSGSEFNPWSGMVVYTSDFGSKIDQFQSDEFDALYDRTVKGDLIFKSEERLQALAEMEQLLFDNVPFVPFMQTRTPYLFSDRVHLITGGQYVPGIGMGIYFSELDPLPTE